MKKTLQIISSTHAREINNRIKPASYHTLSQLANPDYVSSAWEEGRLWQQTESSLKEYRIECYACDGSGIFIDNDSNRVECPIHITYPIGSIHEFDTNEETLTCIVL